MTIESKVQEARNIEIRVNALREQIRGLHASIAEIANTIASVREYSELEKNSESLTALGAGIFAKSTLKKYDKLYVDAGADVIVEKNIGDTVTMLEDAQKRVKSNIDEFEKAIANLQKHYTSLLKQIQQMESKK